MRLVRYRQAADGPIAHGFGRTGEGAGQLRPAICRRQGARADHSIHFLVDLRPNPRAIGQQHEDTVDVYFEVSVPAGGIFMHSSLVTTADFSPPCPWVSSIPISQVGNDKSRPRLWRALTTKELMLASPASICLAASLRALLGRNYIQGPRQSTGPQNPLPGDNAGEAFCRCNARQIRILLTRQPSGPVTAPTRTRMSAAAGGRGRSSGPGCAAPSASSPAHWRCAAGTLSLGSSWRLARISGCRTSDCSRRDAPACFFWCRFAYPLVDGA